jgi:cytochrome c-type biogenesis protein CcmH
LKQLCAIVVAFVALTAAFSARADEALDARLKTLETQLRCLVCQNQTLAESNAPLAEDLRKEVRELAVSGKSDDEIRGYLVARYGDFVLYKPPLKSTTYALWFGPFLLLFVGAIVWVLVLRRRASATSDAVPSAPSGAEAERARALLEDETR